MLISSQISKMYRVLCSYFRMVTYPDQGVTAALKTTQWENHCWCYRSAVQQKADHSTDCLSQKRPHQFKQIFKYKPKSYNYKFTSSAPFGVHWGSWWPTGIRGNWAVFVHGTSRPLWKQESIRSTGLQNRKPLRKWTRHGLDPFAQKLPCAEYCWGRCRQKGSQHRGWAAAMSLELVGRHRPGRAERASLRLPVSSGRKAPPSTARSWFPRLYCHGLSPGLLVFSAKVEQYGSKSRISPATHIKNKNKVIDNLGGNLLYQVQ